MWTVLSQIRRRNKVDVTSMIKSSNSTWSEEDKKLLKVHLLDYLEAEPSYSMFQIFRFDPFMRGLLCAKPEEVFDRLSIYFSNTILLSGLLFAGVASSAMHPIDVFSLKENVRIYGELNNIVSALTVALYMSYAIVSTIVYLIISVESHDPSMTYRSILKMGRHCGYFYLPFLLASMLTCCTSITLPQIIYNESRWSTWIGFLAPIFAFVFIVYFYMMCIMSIGNDMLEWVLLLLFVPWAPYTRKNIVRDLKVRNQNLLKKAKEGVLKIIKEEEENSISTDETM